MLPDATNDLKSSERILSYSTTDPPRANTVLNPTENSVFASIITPRRSPRFQRKPITFSNRDAHERSDDPRCDPALHVARRLPLSEIPNKSAPTATRHSRQDNTTDNCELGALVVADDEEPPVLSKVYTFLHTLNKQKLRALCKRLRCRLAGNKQELLFRAFLFLADIKERNGDVVSFMLSRNEFDGAQRFFDDNKLVTVNLQLVPSRDFMMEHLRAAGDKLNEVESPSSVRLSMNDTAEKDPNFSHSEFARLIIVMRDDERAKEALFALSQELQRPMLDAGLRRDSYWEVIAKRFNDVNLKVRFDFSGSLDDVDASIIPPCSRSSASLKDQFKKARADFTKAYMKWRSSGQNAPERFTEFLSHNGDQLYSSSKRAYIIFLCCQLGTPNSNTILLDSVTKSIAYGGQEEGLAIPAHQAVDDGNDSLLRGPKRRRKSSASIFDDIQDASKSIIEASSAVTKRFQESRSKNASSMSLTPDNSALQLLNVKSKCYGELQTAYDNLQNAMKRGDSVLIGFAQASFDEAKRVCEEVGKESQGSNLTSS